MFAGVALADPGTAITYQGQLKNGGTPAAGPHDLRFRLFDAAVGGRQVGGTICADDVDVVDGLFAVALDFGAVFSAGDPLFLEVDLRPDTGLSCADLGGFISLASRQALMPTPFAGYASDARNALSAATADNSTSLGGQPSTFYRNAANINTGTFSDARLSVNIPRLNAPSTFSGVVTMTNPLNVIAGIGSGLTGLNASNLAGGIVDDGLLSSNVARLNVANVFSNAGNVFVGDGSGLFGLRVSNIVGQFGGAQIADNSIDTFKIAPGAIINSDISDNSITNTKIVNGTITGAKLAVNSVSGGVGGVLTDGSIGNADLQASSITSSNIVDGTIVSIDIAPGAIAGGVTGPIADESITASDLAPNSVGAAELAPGSVGASELAPNAVTTAALAVDAVSSTRLALDAASLARVTGGAMQINAGGVGVGGAAPAGTEFYVANDARVEGAFRAGSFIYTAPINRTVTYSPWDVTHREADSVAVDPLRLHTGGVLGQEQYHIPVHLPTGVRVTRVWIRAQDDDTRDVTVLLVRRDIDGEAGGTMAQVVSNTNDSSVHTFEDTTISAPVISNGAFMYYLEIATPTPLIGALNIRSMSIDYTTDLPSP